MSASSSVGLQPTYSTLSSAAGGAPSSLSSSRAPSRQSSASGYTRKPSMVNMQSFLEGVGHVARVRSPSLRGHSRAGSFGNESSTDRSSSQTGNSRRTDSFSALSGYGSPQSITSDRLSSSYAAHNNRPMMQRKDSDAVSNFSGIGASRPWHLDDVDEVPSWDDNRSLLLTPNSPTPRRNGFFSRNPSATSLRRNELFTNEREPSGYSNQTSPLPIRSAGHSSSSSSSAAHATAAGYGGNTYTPSGIFGDRMANIVDDDDEFAERTFVDRRDDVLFPQHRFGSNANAAAHKNRTGSNDNGQMQLLSPNLGLLDDVDDEDERRHLANLDEANLTWTEGDLNALQEGDRLGIGLMHEGYAVVDALDSGLESPYHEHVSGVEYEIVRQL